MKKPENQKEKKKPEYKLDIFRVLEAIDKKEFDFPGTLSEEEIKQLHKSLYVLLRWNSSVKNSYLEEHYLVATNYIVNHNYWDISGHPELIWKLFCITGAGKPQRHQWISSKSATKTPKIDKLLETKYNNLKSYEMNLLKSRLNKDSITDLAKDYGYEDKEIKELINELKNIS